LSTWKNFRTRFQAILDSLQRHKSLIESQASLLEFQQSQAARALLEEQFSKMQEDERKRQLVAVTAWLSAANSSLDQKNAASERSEYPETGRWLLDNHKMKLWLDSDSSSIPLLWINGIPGAGMTASLEFGYFLIGLRKNHPLLRHHRRGAKVALSKPWVFLLQAAAGCKKEYLSIG
jgi:hypothetical protein